MKQIQILKQENYLSNRIMANLPKQQSINWKQELLDSQRFNKKEEKLLKEGAKSLTDSWYLSALYLRYKRLKGIKDDPIENKGQMKFSLGEFFRGTKK